MDDTHGLDGRFFDGVSARAVPVRVRCDGASLGIDGEGIERRIALAGVKLSPRLGDTRRQIRLPDGGLCEVADDPLLAHWFATAAERRFNLLARLESHWGFVLLAVGLVLGLTLVIALWGLPWAARHVARAVPQPVVAQIGRGTLAGLDRAFGAGTALAPERLETLRRTAQRLADDAQVDARFEFRSWPGFGANALAMPDGAIVITDALVELAGDERELAAVIAHELGHVHERHALQALLNNAGIAALVVVLTGDASSLSNLVVVAPTVLTQMRHSRELERTADHYAFALLAREGIDAGWFASIIRKLESQHRRDEGDAAAAPPAALSWLQSHPDTEQRAREAERYPPASGSDRAGSPVPADA